MKAIVVASIIATHELAAEFNTNLAGLFDRRKEIVINLVEESKVQYAKLSFEFAYSVISARNEPFLEPDVMANDPIRVVRVWVNKEAWLAVSLRNGVKVPPIPERTISSIYYRVDGVLVKAGNSGYDLMRSNVKVSDEQWSALKNGDTTGLLLRDEKKAA